MHQGLAGQVVVDEGRHSAESPKRKKEEDKGVGVLKVQCHHLALPDATPLLEPVGIAKDRVICLGIGVGLVLEAQKDTVL
jgi:hypothetical protein